MAGKGSTVPTKNGLNTSLSHQLNMKKLSPPPLSTQNAPSPLFCIFWQFSRSPLLEWGNACHTMVHKTSTKKWKNMLVLVLLSLFVLFFWGEGGVFWTLSNTLKMEFFSKIKPLTIFAKKLYLSCLTGFWTSFCQKLRRIELHEYYQQIESHIRLYFNGFQYLRATAAH